MPGEQATLYGLALSHPSHAVRLMLDRKGIEHEFKELLPGFHPVQLRIAGFREPTVPALKIDGCRLQRSRTISIELDQICPEPPLFPADPVERVAVENAERWGEQELQPVPRRILRWGASDRQQIRRWLGETAGLLAPGLLGRLNTPIAKRFAAIAGADEAAVRADLEKLPGQLDRVDELIAAGTIGGPDPNAADFQIGTTMRTILRFADLRPVVEGRPAAELGERILPDYGFGVPAFLPPEWLAALRS